MKMRPFLLASALLLVPALSSAAPADRGGSVEAERHPKNVVTIAPVSFLFGSINAEYERAIADSLSFTLGGGYRWLNPSPDGRGAANRITGLNVGAHVFLLGRAPRGLWLGPELGTWIARGSDEEDRYAGIIPRFAFQLGYTGLIANVLAISVGGGIQFYGFIPLPNARLSLGVAF
ncbi:MAG TPA: hypothetical protein VK013_15275 [Myxococcaceae bacterium]|nr:hypothetical protein [Myxococcaceae bacterium]